MKNKGFSLVELIVVIAIMAILVGVAVPVYTSYIEKAQKAKDEQMVDEIKHAIEIAAVGNSWYVQMPNGGAIGTIVLKNGENAVVEGDLLVEAMTATFGSDYATKLQLAYDGWTGTLDAVNAGVIMTSAYVLNENSVSGLLNKVQDVTDAFVTFVDGGGQVSSAVEEYLVSKGISMSDPRQVANGMVLYVADSSSTLDEEAFVAAWQTLDFSSASLGMDVFAQMAAKYAYAEATVNRLNCPETDKTKNLTSTFAEMKALSVGSDQFDVTDPISFVAAHAETCPSCSVNADSITEEMLATDAKAYLALLNQVSQSETKVLENKDNDALYTDSSLTDYVLSYVSVAELVNSGTNGGVADGDVVLVVTMSASGVMSINVYPLEYTNN